MSEFHYRGRLAKARPVPADWPDGKAQTIHGKAVEFIRDAVWKQDGHEAIQQATDLALVAAAIGETPNDVRRAIEGITELPWHFLIHQFKALRVCEMMLGNVSIREARKVCGFSSMAQLYAVFNKHFGLTPGQWKKRMRA